MSRLTDYERRIEQYAVAAETAGALEDINALRMRSIRSRFEKNQQFFDEIRALYGIVHANALREKSQEAAQQASVLYVAVTANRRFAGTLARDTIDALARELAAHPEAACLVVGRLGWQYLEAAGLAARARQILFAGEEPTEEEFASLLAHTARFDRVLVFYGRFITAFRQEVELQDITQSPELTGDTAETYIFEPELTALLAFFDAQVRYVLFARILLESDLSRTAARFITMEESRQRASELLAAEERGRTRELAATSNAALLETVAGYGHWYADSHD